jgi:hypothetical protein
MNRSKMGLDQISVASPCPMAWDDMAGDERVRSGMGLSLEVEWRN